MFFGWTTTFCVFIEGLYAHKNTRVWPPPRLTHLFFGGKEFKARKKNFLVCFFVRYGRTLPYGYQKNKGGMITVSNM